MAKIEEVKEEDLQALGVEVKDQLAAAKEKYGDAYVLIDSESDVAVVCKRPRRSEYKKFRTERYDAAKKADAFENLFLSCLVWPAPKDFKETLERLPAIGDSFGMSLFDKVAGVGEIDVKKA